MIKPMGEMVLVKEIEPDEKIGSVYVPIGAQRNQVLRGTVVAVGDGELSKTTGNRLPMTLEADDEIFFNVYAGTHVNLEGSDLLLLRESEILARVRD